MSLPTTKTLGVVWNAEKDIFAFKIAFPTSVIKTKRSFLRLTASLFDPQGVLAPYVMRAKIIMQAIWIMRFDWDDYLY